MRLKGSCHCGKIKFTVLSKNFYPYQYCYCSICRKTQGGGGYSINLSADAGSMKVKGEEYLSTYRARVKDPGERKFCKLCGSFLWLFDPTWPELVHPFASAIDSSLPKSPEHTHLMLEFRPSWVELHKMKKDKTFKRYPKESISEWHDRVLKRR